MEKKEWRREERKQGRKDWGPGINFLEDRQANPLPHRDSGELCFFFLGSFDSTLLTQFVLIGFFFLSIAVFFYYIQSRSIKLFFILLLKLFYLNQGQSVDFGKKKHTDQKNCRPIWYKENIQSITQSTSKHNLSRPRTTIDCNFGPRTDYTKPVYDHSLLSIDINRTSNEWEILIGDVENVLPLSLSLSFLENLIQWWCHLTHSHSPSTSGKSSSRSLI